MALMRVFGVAAFDLEQLGPEAQRKHQHADAVPARHQEMSQLVHENQHTEDEPKCEKRGHGITLVDSCRFRF